MMNFNKQAAFFGGLFGIALTLIIGLIGFMINISARGDAFTIGEAAKQGKELGLFAVIFVLVIAVTAGFIKKKKA